MRKNKAAARILLAVDMKANDPKAVRRVWDALLPLRSAEGATVQPVTVLDRADATLGASLRNQIGTLRTAAERHLADSLSQLKVENVLPPKVLFADGSSTRQSVTELLHYAKETGCDLIALATHSRKGLARFFVGSFAETLTLHSTLPLFVVNPRYRAAKSPLGTVLFATDFSAKSKLALATVCASLKAVAPRIVLFHAMPLPQAIFAEPFSLPISESLLKREIADAKKFGAEMLAGLRADGFEGEFVLDTKTASVSEAISKAATRKKAGLVAVASNSGKLEIALFGSVARQVLRDSKVPVWVVHPQSTEVVTRVAPIGAAREKSRAVRGAID